MIIKRAFVRIAIFVFFTEYATTLAFARYRVRKVELLFTFEAF